MAASLVLLIGLTSGTWHVFFNDMAQGVPKVNEILSNPGNPQAILTHEAESVFEDVIDLDPFDHLPLRPGSTMSRVSMNLSLELIDIRFKEPVNAMADRIREIISGQVQQMTWLSLRTPEGKIMFKYMVLKRINSLFPKATVRNIYFTFFIMQ
ncbi:flagellar basal body-associated FliL family protein [Desulfobacula sp.]|uniref:flagellar basal body-associated FliL family protein n=1 Tax=Desulfobacula sp. TaxID=2593537 RepID=UPI00260BD4F5|nr:flagellar basal body-associated FliL family protein [Desulfobacula sp.]